MEKSEVKRRVYHQKVKCPKCGHVFKTRRKSFWVGCGFCGAQFKRVENIVKGEISIIKTRRYHRTVECPKCGYVFKTWTKARLTTCHKCNSRFNIVESRIIGGK